MEYTIAITRHPQGGQADEPIYLRRFDDSNTPAIALDVEGVFGDIEEESNREPISEQ